MNQQSPDASPSLQPVYVALMVVLIVVSLVAYTVAPWAMAFALNWPRDWRQLASMSVPMVQHSVLWQGKLCVPHLETNMFNPKSGSLQLAVIDLKSHATTIIKTQAPLGQQTLVVDEATLWCVTRSSVVRIQDGQVTETQSDRTLRSPESAFLYQGHLAVIENAWGAGTNGTGNFGFQLLVWTGSKWESKGQLVLPRPIDKAGNSSFGGSTQVRAVDFHGKTHWFCTDGGRTLYSSEETVVPDGAVSALDPENSGMQVPGWTTIGSLSDIQLGSDAQGLLVVEMKPQFGRRSLGTGAAVWRLRDGQWVEGRQLSQRGTLNSQLVSDGSRAYSVGMTFTQDLSIMEIGESEATSSILAIEETEASLEKLTQSVQKHGWWTPYPIAFLFSFLMSRLMSVYRSDRYEFGNRTVELASVFRRTLAKAIDWIIVVLPLFIAQWAAFGTSDQDKIAKEIQMLIADPIDLLRKALFVLLGVMVYGLTCLAGIGIIQGRWGISPGKWLLGIRVVRTTLRPCGILRAMLRELMLVVDCVMCFGWLPAACCVAFTACRQRIGDLVADTVVIRQPVVAVTIDEAIL